MWHINYLIKCFLIRFKSLTEGLSSYKNKKAANAFMEDPFIAIFDLLTRLSKNHKKKAPAIQNI